MIQFPEHNDGMKSNDSKVAKLDKLAKLLKVLIHIDGIPYGSNTPVETKVVKESEEIVEQVSTKEPEVNVENQEPAKPRRGRPKKN